MPFDPALVWASMPRMLHGMLNTVTLTALTLVLGLALAMPITLARMSRRRLFSLPAAAFVMFFRGTPALILLYLVYYGLAQLPVVGQDDQVLIFPFVEVQVVGGGGMWGAVVCRLLGGGGSEPTFCGGEGPGGAFVAPAGRRRDFAFTGASLEGRGKGGIDRSLPMNATRVFNIYIT